MNKIAKKLGTEVSYYSHRYVVPPEFVSLLVTFRCNFHCKSCSIWQKKEHNDLSAEQWITIARDMAKTLPATTFIEVNGGEALLRRDLVLRLIPELKQYFHTIALNSNGLLIDDAVTQQLAEAGLDILKVSFYSLNPATHDTLRGHPKAFEHARRAIEHISKTGMGLEIGILVTKQNIAEIPELLEFLKQFPRTTAILQALDESVESASSKGYGASTLPQELWPVKKDVIKFFTWMKKQKSAVKNSPDNIRALEEYYLNPESVLQYRCFTGQRNVVIYPNGDVTLCFKGGPIGNATTQPLKKLLHGKTAEQARSHIATCQKYCRIVGCNFSRGIPEYIRDLAKTK